MFLQVSPDSNDRVYHVMMNMPIGWNQHLTPAMIRNTTTLQLRSRELQDTLINSAVSTAANLVTSDNIVSVLQKAGFYNNSGIQNYGKTPTASGSSYRKYNSRVANTTVHSIKGAGDEVVVGEDLSDNAAIIHQAFAVMKQGEPPPSRRGPFPFNKQVQVHTAIGRLPVWPCRACGSANHWDKECLMWDRFQSKIRSAKWVETEDPVEDGQLYTQVYQTFLAQIEESMYVLSEAQIEVEVQLAEKLALISSTTPDTAAEPAPSISRKSSVEEVDDEDQVAQCLMPKAQGASALEDAEEESFETGFFAARAEVPKDEEVIQESENQQRDFEPPTMDVDPIKIPKLRKAAPERAAVGTSVLSIRGHVGRTQEREIDL